MKDYVQYIISIHVKFFQTFLGEPINHDKEFFQLERGGNLIKQDDVGFILILNEEMKFMGDPKWLITEFFTGVTLSHSFHKENKYSFISRTLPVLKQIGDDAIRKNLAKYDNVNKWDDERIKKRYRLKSHTTVKIT